MQAAGGQELLLEALAALVEAQERCPRGPRGEGPPVHIHVHEEEGEIKAAGEVDTVLTPNNLEEVFKIKAYVKFDEEIGTNRVNIISVSENGKGI